MLIMDTSYNPAKRRGQRAPDTDVTIDFKCLVVFVTIAVSPRGSSIRDNFTLPPWTFYHSSWPEDRGSNISISMP